MPNIDNAKKTLWIYAVILFTSAFVVLLLTGYSQIKFNKSIDEYKDKISMGENEKSKFQLTLSSVLEENRKLKNENTSLKNGNITNKKTLQEKEAEVASLGVKNTIIQKNYEALLEAQNEYNAGNITGCAILLATNCSRDILGSIGLSKYNHLSGLTFNKAAIRLYESGYSLYLKKNYDKAIEKFTQSLSIEKNGYYSDDCYYFIAYSEYRKGNLKTAKNTLKELLDTYPQTTYLEEAKNMLKELE